ncbi:hypothetical protein HanRHA438_Chr10g0447071 [Helianthus annuus]|nr:hypothetical protein HanIR_Chr10g0468981 [Helianthus annuus]KAJ0879067.1 hypothetical protein HanRHA438_Chr10g0447071 [Helianthus annuus]
MASRNCAYLPTAGDSEEKKTPGNIIHVVDGTGTYVIPYDHRLWSVSPDSDSHHLKVSNIDLSKPPSWSLV